MGRELLLEIDAIADRGTCIGRDGGKAVFVEMAAPGDTVKVRITRNKPKFMLGELLEVVQPSASRISPRCQYYGKCGGCAWQHIDYESQFMGKVASFTGFISTRLGLVPGQFADPIPSPLPYGYRNRVSFNVVKDSGETLVGFSALRSDKTIPIASCPVLVAELNNVIEAVNRFLSETRPHTPERIRMQRDGEGGVWLIVHYREAHVVGRAGEKTLRALQSLEASGLFAGVFTQSGRSVKHTSIGVTTTLMPFSSKVSGRQFDYGVPVGSFVQANASVAHAMLERVMAQGEELRDKNILELYCGSGFFTLPLAGVASSVTAVEGDPRAIAALESNARGNQLDNITATSCDVGKALTRLKTEGARFDHCLLDPPRTGAADAIATLAALCPDRITYVSCSPPTLARDLSLLKAQGYRIDSICAADIFPQTAHLEALAFLSRG